MVTARVTPTGPKLRDGYRTLIAFELDPDIQFWEKNVTPPGLDGGDMIEQTTYHSDFWRTFAPRSLVTMTDASLVAAWNPAVYNQILAIINVPQMITIWFSNGMALELPGVLRVAEPQETSEGEQPEINITLSFTMEEDNGSGNEFVAEMSTVTTTTTTTVAPGAPINPFGNDFDQESEYGEDEEEEVRGERIKNHRDDDRENTSDYPEGQEQEQESENENPTPRRTRKGKRPGMPTHNPEEHHEMANA